MTEYVIRKVENGWMFCPSNTGSRHAEFEKIYVFGSVAEMAAWMLENLK